MAEIVGPRFVEHPTMAQFPGRCRMWVSAPPGPWLLCTLAASTHSWWLPPDKRTDLCWGHFDDLMVRFPKALALWHTLTPVCVDPRSTWNTALNRCELPPRRDTESVPVTVDWDAELERLTRLRSPAA